MARLLTLLLVFALGLVGGTLLLSVARPREPYPISVGADQSAEAALERPVDEIRLENMPIREAVETIAARAGIVVEADWARLEAMDRKLGKVTLSRRGEKLADLLREALNQSLSDYSVWIEPNGDRIRLWHHTDPNPPRTPRMYDLRSLIGPRPKSIFQKSDEWASPDDVQSIVDLLGHHVTVAPFTGTGGTWFSYLESVDGRVIVVERWEVHRQIREILTSLYHADTPTRPLPTTQAVYTWNSAAGRWVLDDPPAIEAMLEKPIPELRLTSVTFDEAVQAVAKASGIRIAVDAVSLEGTVDPSYRESVLCPAGTAGDALDAVMGRRWGSNFSYELRYEAFEGGLRIDRNWDSPPRTYVRYYDLRDWPPYRNEAKQAVKRDTGLYGTASPTTDLLVKSLLENVEEHTWHSNGGRYQLIDASGYHGVLFVRQTIQGHRRVQQYLSALRTLPIEKPSP